jgi:ComEC/Rec2-related protein
LLALWGYAGLTGACPSVLRATIMFSLFTVAGMSARRADPLNSLFAAALLLLVWDSHMLIEIGFQLSFLAVLGIILFHGPMERLWVPNNKWVGHIWTLSVMSIAAQLLTTPLSLYLFKAFPVWFLPANLVVVTAAGFAVYGAVALLVLYRVPLLGPLLASLLTILLVVVDRVTGFFAGLPGAYPAIRVGAVDMLLLYVLVAAVAAWLMWRWRPALQLSLVTLAVLLVGWVMHIREAHERVTFTVYDDRKALQAAMTVGRSHMVLSDDDISNEEAWMRKKVDRHQRALGLHTAEVVPTTGLVDRTAQRIGSSFDVRFVSGSELKEGLLENDAFDVLVLHDVRYLGPRELEGVVLQAKQVVLTGNMAWGARSFAKRWYTDRGIPVHDVRDQGAFVMTVGDPPRKD